MAARTGSKALGGVSEAALDAGAPFAVVTWFDASIDVSIRPVGSFKDLEASCDQFRQSGNIFYALRLDGRFKSVRARAVNPLKEGTGLVDAAKAQSESPGASVSRRKFCVYLLGLRPSHAR